MAKGKKYDFRLEQNGATWSAQITRQVTSRKIITSQQQDGFSSETDAREWAESRLAEFMLTQNSINQRQGEQRKNSEEERRLRSSRRADKTAQAKLEKLQEQQKKQSLADAKDDLSTDLDGASDLESGVDLATEYDFGPD